MTSVGWAEPETRRGDFLAWLALAGVASPIVLAVAAIAVAAGRPEYSHLHQTLN